MTPLSQCAAEQARIAAYEGPDKRGARQGMEDWLMEEAIIRAEEKALAPALNMP